MNNSSICPACTTRVQYGVHVCPGPNCGRGILYKATRHEVASAFVYAACCVLLVVCVGPMFFTGSLAGNGLALLLNKFGVAGLLIPLVLAVVAGVIASSKIINQHHGVARFICR